jgi:histidine triad (HIT) family protein
MYNHKPKNYICPFCTIGKLEESPFSLFKLNHLVYHDKDLSVFISSAKWPKNPGIALIIPNKHYENIYEMPENLLAKTHVLAKKIALAMKKGYKCDGVSTRQHNEPAGNQEVWHYHFQVFPRYHKDHLYVSHMKKRNATDAERAKYAAILKKYLTK